MCVVCKLVYVCLTFYCKNFRHTKKEKRIREAPNIYHLVCDIKIRDQIIH